MRGLGSKIEAGIAAWCVRGVCPTRSHLLHASGAAKTGADWAFVSGVSLVSPSMTLIEEYRVGDEERHWKGLIGALPLALRQVGQVQRCQGLRVRQQGRDTCETAETGAPFYRVQGHKVPV
jgi:hypothetical protein